MSEPCIDASVVVKLVLKGFFTDRVPETGLITVFYENDVRGLAELLG
jgi:hypothetical protein